MRSILLHIADDEGLEARIQVALGLARAFDSHVTCLQATPFEVGVPGDLYGTMAAQLIPSLREAADALHERHEARMAREDVRWDWVQLDGPAAEHLIRKSGLADVVILGCSEQYGDRPSRLAGDVILRSQTPVLVVPPTASGLDCDGTAIVAWDGSPEASRALRAARPLLERANSVVLATVEEWSARTMDLPPTEGAEYLSRHGVSCEMVELFPDNRSVSEVLSSAASARAADYLVMGAYGHMRLIETVWGGVSQSLLRHPPLPVFACH